MERLFSEIIRAVEVGLYQLALNSALCIPDICSGLESEDGKTNGRKYREWYDKYMVGKLQMTAADCYYFRCSMLHQGSTEHERSTYNKVLFIEPTANKGIFHDNIIDGALNIDIRIFCNDMVNAGKLWLEENKNTERFKTNFEKSFKRYPNGLMPYVWGAPVYA